MDALLGRWNSMPASQQPDHLAERMEELFLEASMLEAVRPRPSRTLSPVCGVNVFAATPSMFTSR